MLNYVQYPFLHIMCGLLSTALVTESYFARKFFTNSYFAYNLYDNRVGLTFFSIVNLILGCLGVDSLTYDQCLLVISFVLAYAFRIIFFLKGYRMATYENLKFFLHTIMGIVGFAIVSEIYLVDLYCETSYCIADSFIDHEIPLIFFSIFNLLIGLSGVFKASDLEIKIVTFLILSVLLRYLYFNSFFFEDDYDKYKENHLRKDL